MASLSDHYMKLTEWREFLRTFELTFHFNIIVRWIVVVVVGGGGIVVVI